MIINLIQYKRDKFHKVVRKLRAEPECYLNFDHVADFYQAAFLDEFPSGTTWFATGLDDGAEHFEAVIQYQDCYIRISKMEHVFIRTSLDNNEYGCY